MIEKHLTSNAHEPEGKIYVPPKLVTLRDEGPDGGTYSQLNENTNGILKEGS